MTRQQKLRLSLPIVALLALVLVFAFSRSGHSAPALEPRAPATVSGAPAGSAASIPLGASVPAALASDPILEIDTATLTTYLANPTSGQLIEPGVDFRGVDLDGRLRKDSSLGMHLAGNPIGPFPPGTQSIAGVTLMNGAVTQEDVDLAFPADGPRWVIGRTYNSRQDGGSTVSNGYQGRNWFQTAQPEIQLTGAEGHVYLFYGADRFIEFKSFEESKTTYRAVNGAAGVIVLTSSDELEEGIPDLWTYTDQAGWEYTFFGFDADGGSAPGQIWKIEAPSGEVAYVGDPDINNDPVTLGYNGSKMALAFDSEGRRYTFTYTTHDGVSRLDEVEVDIKDSGTWGSPTNLRTIGRVEYFYYSSETYGDPGDLKRVKITTRVNGSGTGNDLVREKYYRYWEGTFNASTNPGHPHSLQYVYDFEGIRQYDWANGTVAETFDEDDYLTASSGSLAPFASGYFEYDTNKRCIEISSEGGCGGCGGGSAHGTVLFTYEANGSFSPISSYDTEWARRALAQRADGSFLTQYLDEVGQALSHLITDATPASGTPSKWVTEVQRSSAGITTQVATPAAVTSYTHSTGAVVSSDASGLIRYWTVETSGATTGFALSQKFNRDKDSSRYLEWSRTFVVGSLAVGDTTVYRPLVDDEREYPVAITSGTSGSNLIARAFTWHSGTLSPKEITVTWPTVTTANNGPNSATTSRAWLDAVGRTVWTQAEDGVIDYTLYAGGLVTKSIRDADTSLTGSGQVFNGITMPGWTLGSGPFHRVDEASYDDGFQRTATQADGRKLVSYKSVLKDRRMISLSYGDLVSTTFHGPVEFSITNQAGRGEAQGRVALSGNTTTTATSTHVDENESDPLLALDLGTVCRYRTSLLNETGTELEFSRTYFDVPSSGDGTSGTHYDQEEYAYDSMGRQNRRELPHVGLTPANGTVYKTAYDVLGRVTSRSIGTDDSGTGSDNMVVTELLEYDGNADDGNSLLTERTERTTATSTGERVTGYAYDVRGQLLLTTGASAPHSLVKYDNMGRETARGEFSSAPSATADPTSTTSGRMALSASEFDQRGRVCRSHFYNINPSNGANTSSEVLTTDFWYDATGRQIMVEGEKLSKTFYDRLGRETHSFLLAKEDDANKRTYAGADDVASDIVLVEHQTVYESTLDDNVVLRATIERFHDDYGGGETTGALDTNADSDRKVLTAGNLEGRVQISAMWYDSLDRLKDVAAYGTNGGSTFTRTSLSAPSRPATVPLTTYDYDETGEQFSIVDAKDAETRYGVDDAGRQTSVTQNYEDGTPESLEPDKDQIVRHGYVNGLRTTYTADLPSSDQVTTYIYGTKRSSSSVEDSAVATSHLLYQVRYPDYDPTPGSPPVSDADIDTVTYAYSVQSEEIYRRDQDGTVLEKVYDLSGRLVSETATALGTNIDDLGIGSDIDGAVRLKQFAYDGLGRMMTATQYDATTSGTILDQVEHTYGEWGRMTSFALDVDSAVTGGSGIAAYVCSMDYTRSWAAVTPASRSGSRLILADGVTMPSGFSYTFVQDSARYHEQAGRTNSVKDQVPTTVASFEFVGDRRMSRVALDVHDFVMDYADGASGGSYLDWDQFNRIVEDEWVKDLATDRKFLHRTYTLDQGGFIEKIFDYIERNPSAANKMDTLLTLDGLNRLTDLQRGTLVSGAIANTTMEWNRTLDLVGNASRDLLDWTGDGDQNDPDEHDKTLSFGVANEIALIDAVAPTYSRSGMLLDDLRLEYVYDAWGRIVRVKNATGGATLANYRRNALDHLIGEQLDRQPDNSINGSDYWEHFLTRPSDMGMLASFRASDDDPLVERLWLGDLESSATGSFYAPVVLERRDDNYDGTVDRDTVVFIDRTGSVIGNYGDDGAAGKQVERLHYNMTSQPFLMAWGDVDGDGDADSSDDSWIGFLWSFSLYDVRADLDLDGDVDSADYAAHAQDGGGVLVSNDENTLGSQALHSRYGQSYALERVLNQALGVWTSRDPLEYIDGGSLYMALAGNRLAFTDRTGRACLNTNTILDWPPQPPYPYGKNGPGDNWYHLPPLGLGGCNASVFISNPISSGSYMFFGVLNDSSRSGVCSTPPTDCTFNFNLVMNVEEINTRPVDSSPGGRNGPFFQHWHGPIPGEYPRWGHFPTPVGRLNPGHQGSSQAGFSVDTTLACGEEKNFTVVAAGPPTQATSNPVQPPGRPGGAPVVQINVVLKCSACPGSGGGPSSPFSPRPTGHCLPGSGGSTVIANGAANALSTSL